MENDILTSIFAATGLMFLLVLSIIGFTVIYQRKLLLQKLALQESERAHQEDLLKNSIQVIESERQRIAKDLHDEIGANLTALKMGNHRVMKNLKEPEKVGSISADNKQIIEQSIKSTRQIIHNLLPGTLERHGLLSALNESIHLLANNPTIELRLNHNLAHPEVRFEKNLELGFYRIVRELLNNTLKYAEASLVHIDLNFREDAPELKLTYSDNGKGFDMEQARLNPAGGGLGMKSIETRVRGLDAQMNFRSAPGQGVEVEITTPLGPLPITRT